MLRRVPSLWLAGWVMLSCTSLPEGASAQLISPGKLSSAHAKIEGIRNCTQCHELRKAGISEALCLKCHAPLAERMDAGEGFHGTLPNRACATCHKEHLGADFDLVRLDTARFDHALTGYALEGRHAETGCRSCHTPDHVADPKVRAAKTDQGALDRTFLGLPSGCSSCHESDSPHDTQFARRGCTDCHDTGGWKGAKEFDHDRAAFHLTGRHREVACAKCHATTPRPGDAPPSVRYVGLRAARCNDCHEDQHHGAMAGRCESCHSTAGWRRVDRNRVESTFDHSTTGFRLEGSHASAPCASCHQAGRGSAPEGIRIRFQAGTQSRSFPRPDVKSGTCLSCHEDRHAGVFAKLEGGEDCRGCHGQDGWLPALFDVVRHNRDTSFPLKGAHLAVACESCHAKTGDVPTFQIEAMSCADCHAATNPHGDQFAGRACESCHTVESFHIESFDHDATRFPLDGAHRGAPCSACHRPATDAKGASVIVYRPLGTDCRDCHGGAS